VDKLASCFILTCVRQMANAMMQRKRSFLFSCCAAVIMFNQHKSPLLIPCAASIDINGWAVCDSVRTFPKQVPLAINDKRNWRTNKPHNQIPNDFCTYCQQTFLYYFSKKRSDTRASAPPITHHQITPCY